MSDLNVPNQFPFVSSETSDRIRDYLRLTLPELEQVLKRHPLQPFLDAQCAVDYPYEFIYLPDEILSVYEDIDRIDGRATLGKFNKVVTLMLLSQFEDVARVQPVPPEFHESLPAFLETIVQYLFDGKDEDYIYPHDFLIKDIRALTGRSYVYKRRLIDYNVYVRPRICRFNGWKANLSCAWFLLTRIRGFGPFIRGHIDHRHFDHDPDDFVFEYRTIQGRLMELNPHLRGQVASGWMIDPALAEVSPRYKSRQSNDKAGRSYLRYDGPSEEMTRNAIKTSKTRREAYERGDYKPVSYTRIRSRKGLMERSADAKKRLAELKNS